MRFYFTTTMAVDEPALTTYTPENKALREAVMKFCQARLSPPLLGQVIAEASIDAPRSYGINTYEKYIERRNCLIDELNKLPGVYSPIPMGAFYTVARLPIDDSD